MKKKILGVLLTLVLAVTGFGLVGCGGGNNPAPGPGPRPGPEPAPVVSYDDDTTPVAIDETGLLFDLWTQERMEEDGWGNIPDYNLAYVYAVTEEVVDLVIPAYVTDGENEYKVVSIENLVFTIDNVDDFNYTGVNELATGIKTITIPSTVEWVYGLADWYNHQETPGDNDSWVEEPYYLENLESIILNNRTADINIYDCFGVLCDAIIARESPDAETEERIAIFLEIINQFCTHDEENDLYYLGNPGNPYMLLVMAGLTYRPDDEFAEAEELVANVNGNCKIIGGGSFDSSAVTEVILPNGLVTIGLNAFNYCWALENVILPNSVVTIGDSAFAYCYALESVILPEGLEAIWDYAFNDCNNLEELVIPTTVKHIGYNIVSENSTVLYVDHDLAEELAGCGAEVVYVLKTIVDEAEEGVYPFDYRSVMVTYDPEEEDNVERVFEHDGKEYYGFCLVREWN